MLLHQRRSWCWMGQIYNSRNFICFYTAKLERKIAGLIYNSRNFICFYTCDDLGVLAAGSTIVEILYAFTPNSLAELQAVQSTIVEILYAFTPHLGCGWKRCWSTIVEILYAFTPYNSTNQDGHQSTIVEILYAFTPYACKVSDYKWFDQIIVRKIKNDRASLS